MTPERFGPQPIDFEPERPFTVPAAPPAFNSVEVESVDFELSPSGQGEDESRVTTKFF